MDNYIVSARKYRPDTFQSVIGQPSLTTTLKNAIVTNKLAHAYLFCGPRGVGKTTCARIFAKSINCMSPKNDGEPCNECESCRSFNENRSLNIHELDAASNNSVEDIRSLVDQVRIPPQLGKYKVYIIDEVHMLSSSAFNAFLKTLEEPPHYTIFILATTEKHKILPTILSRCQIYDFNRININDIVNYLEYVSQSENITAEREALNVIAQKADGGMRDALSIFDQVVSFSQEKVTYKSVIENLNVLDYEYYFSLIDAFLKNDVSKSLLLFDEILSKGFDGQHFISGLSGFFRDVLVCKDPQTIVLFEVGDAIKDKYIAVASQCSNSFLYKALEMANECDLNYRVSKNKRLLIELLLIRLAQLTLPVDPEESKKKTIIKPLEASITNSPQTTPVSSNKPMAQSEEVVVSISSPVVKRESISKPIVSNGEAPISFSLKNRGKQIESSVSETIDYGKKQDMNNDFSENDLLRFWRVFAEMQEDVHLKNTMLNSLPKLDSDYLIQISIANPAQETIIKETLPELKAYLSRELSNTFIQFKIKMNESSEKRPFLSHEKHQHMVEKNPELRLLISEFNLRLD
ncbi:DNA polymerase III subunit gamma/tau [Bacteroidales bacterium OttesenSCG-928-M11]|nr:DNA polymerase III subunit gamma/tau [Bacteroidales bacterium OttesenSCG-928-M11]